MSLELKAKTKHFDHYIAGEFRPSRAGKTFDDINPATGSRLATVALGGKEEIDEAVRAARAAFDRGPWPRMSLKERCQILRKVGDLIL